MIPSTTASEDSKSSGAVVPSVSPPAVGAAPRGGAALLVLGGRILLLAAAGLALVAAFRLAGARDRERAAAEEAGADRYVCPMHPEVVSRVPGECPICRMALERAGADKGPALDRSGTIDVVARRVVTQLVRVPAWAAADGTVTAILHEDDLVGLAPAERASFFGTSAAGVGAPARLSSTPPASWDRGTVRALFTLEGAGHKPDTGWLELAARPCSSCRRARSSIQGPERTCSPRPPEGTPSPAATSSSGGSSIRGTAPAWSRTASARSWC